MDTTEVTIKKMLLQATLKANLDTLRVHFPDLFNKFKDYIPQNSGVVIDEHNNVNLFNKGKYVYDRPAELFATEEMTSYLKKPQLLNLDFKHKVDEEIIYEHEKKLKHLYTKRVGEVGRQFKNSGDGRIDFFCMFGVGLGYQITELFKEKKILNFLLCEPSDDIFFAMLHCVDLKSLVEHCKNQDGKLMLVVGKNAVDSIKQISIFFKRTGSFYLNRMALYRHYVSDTTTEIYNIIAAEAYRWSSGWGFMEDEIIGLAHTIINVDSGYKFCKKPAFFVNSHAKKPVFLIGNGPSLDSAIPFLKEHQKDIIIVSCGTSLKALLKNNIKPDIHVENERPVGLIPFVEAIEEQQQSSNIKLKDIQIVGLNTVHPDLLAKFKNPLLLNKYYDAGASLIDLEDKKQVYVAPLHTNPTCTNTGMGVIASLGFEKVYLIGTDYGYVSIDHHHSKDSIFYDTDFELKEMMNKRMTADLEVKGNFRDSVLTTHVFDASKAQVEALLKKNPQIKSYNCSDGAYIDGSQPLHIEALGEMEAFDDKAIFMESLLKNAFDNKQLKGKGFAKLFARTFNVLKVTVEQLMLIIDKEVDSREEMADLFAKQHHLLLEISRRKEYRVNYLLIQGSINYFQNNIMLNCYYYDDLEERNIYMNYCLALFKEHMQFLYQKLLDTYTKVDVEPIH